MNITKRLKVVITLVLIIVVVLGTTATAFAYSNGATIGPVAPGTTKQGYITRQLGKNQIYGELVSGSIAYGENITILVVKKSNGQTITSFNLNYANTSYSYGVSFAPIGDCRVTIQNNTSSNATVLVRWQ